MAKSIKKFDIISNFSYYKWCSLTRKRKEKGEVLKEVFKMCLAVLIAITIIILLLFSKINHWIKGE